MGSSLPPSGQGPGTYKLLAQSREEEDQFNFVQHREGFRASGVFGSTAHMIKGALGAGVLSGHVAYMKAGVASAVPLNIICGAYMCYCLHILVKSAQVLYRRTRVASLTYSDVGEAAAACFPSPRINRMSWAFRVVIDTIICIDLCGACACYQIIIAKSLKQLVENTHKITFHGGHPGYPGLRVYMAAMIIPIILICWIHQLKWLAPFSVAANFVVVFCIGLTVFYAIQENPNFENMVMYTKFYHQFEFLGMSVFSMSCAGVVIPIENNMKDPSKFPLALVMGMTVVVISTFLVSFFGYVGYLENSQSPITVNFPMDTLPKILKGSIVLMIYVTHALNFWVPFNISFFYIKRRFHKSKKNLLIWELFYRSLFVCLIAIVAIVFPNIDNLLGFIGAFCLSNMAFIWPNIIRVMVIWDRPGFGKYKWRLWKHMLLIAVGCLLLVCGSVVNGYELFKGSVELSKDEPSAKTTK